MFFFPLYCSFKQINSRTLNIGSKNFQFESFHFTWRVKRVQHVSRVRKAQCFPCPDDVNAYVGAANTSYCACTNCLFSSLILAWIVAFTKGMLVYLLLTVTAFTQYFYFFNVCVASPWRVSFFFYNADALSSLATATNGIQGGNSICVSQVGI